MRDNGKIGSLVDEPIARDSTIPQFHRKVEIKTEQKTMKIYHNPRCRKSRETLEIIKSKGQEPEIIEYLNTPPGADELKEVLGMLGMKASEILRKGEQVYKDNYKGKDLSEDEWIDAMIEHPKLMERPIVVKGKKAVLGRPPENVNDLL